MHRLLTARCKVHGRSMHDVGMHGAMLGTACRRSQQRCIDCCEHLRRTPTADTAHIGCMMLATQSHSIDLMQHWVQCTLPFNRRPVGDRPPSS
jgi:hypothetical protein